MTFLSSPKINITVKFRTQFLTLVLLLASCCNDWGASGSIAQAQSTSQNTNTNANANLNANLNSDTETQQPLRDYDDVFGETNARTLLMTARQHLRHHNYQRAIVLLAKAVKLDPDDIDVHNLYATALEEKLSNQVDKDPELFNRCIQELLIVVRNEAGDEKGLTYKGIGLGAGYYQDEERTMAAKRSLKKLTGYLPKPWETDARYLRRVLRPTSTSVMATIKMPDLDKSTKQSKTGNR